MYQGSGVTKEPGDDPEPDYTPSSRMSYASIIDKNLFRPEREEYQAPPIIDDFDDDIQPSSLYPSYPGPIPQPEIKKPDLFGIIIIGDSKKYAIMQGWTREEQTERMRKIRLPNGQIMDVPLPSMPGQMKRDKINAYGIGDYVSEAQVVDILPDKVILEQENRERYELPLRDATKIEKENTMIAEGMTPGSPVPGSEAPGGVIGVQGGLAYPIPSTGSVYPSYVPSVPMPVMPGYVPRGIVPPPGSSKISR